MSNVLGRKITHKRLTDEEELALFASLGLPADYAVFLNGIERDIAGGSEERAFKSEKAIIGKEELKDYFEANKPLWVL